MSTTGTASVETEPQPESAFRWRVTHRPDTRFGHAAGGVAGILVVAAGVAFTAAIDNDDPQIAGIVINAVLIAAAVLAGYWVRGPVRSTAVTTVVLAAPLLWIFAVLGETDGVERSDTRLVLLLVAASYVAMYLLTWTRGRAVFLGTAAFVLVNWLLFEVADTSAPFGVGAAEEFQQRGPGGNLVGGDNSRSVAVITVIVALALLAGGLLLDRRRARGIATPLLVVGSIYAIVGALALGSDVEDVYATGIFLALAGLAIGFAGAFGQRRATSWLGALVLLSGAVTLVIQGTDDSTSGSGGEEAFGAFALIAAAVLLVIGVLIARATDEPIDGGEPAVVPQPAPEPEPALVGAPAEDTTAEAPIVDTTPTDAGATDAPATDAPATDAPATDAPATDTTPGDGADWSGPPPEA